MVTNALSTPIRARYIRIIPWGWYKHMSMRVEFYGCFVGKLFLKEPSHGIKSYFGNLQNYLLIEGNLVK